MSVFTFNVQKLWQTITKLIKTAFEYNSNNLYKSLAKCRSRNRREHGLSLKTHREPSHTTDMLNHFQETMQVGGIRTQAINVGTERVQGGHSSGLDDNCWTR